VHRLLKWPLLESPGTPNACKFVPALRLRNPFASVQRFQPRSLQAVRLHCRAIIVTHCKILPTPVYFLPLRRSHYDYGAELFLNWFHNLASIEVLLDLPSHASAVQHAINIARAVAAGHTSKPPQLKLLEIKVCDGNATSNRDSDVPLRPQRTDELGADPDTAIYLELPWYLDPPWRLFC
jgi:hypothetical protein